MNEINIALASDNNYAQHLGITIISILENSGNPENVNFHILENGINQENIENIKSIAKKYNCKLSFYKIDQSQTQNFPEIDYLTKAAYLRLFLPNIIPQEINKILYLDCDLVVLKDIRYLYEIDLKNKPLAAVKDVKSQEIIRIYFYHGLKSYFNSGVMLIDLGVWRKQNVTEKSIEFINKHAKELTTADQDVLNCLFKDDWLELPKIYNTDPKHEAANSLPAKDTAILHYSDKIKPWSYLYFGKNKKYYFKYLALSPWQDFQYKDKSTKNLLKKNKLVIIKEIKNKIRLIVPNKIIDWNKRRFLKKLKK